MEVFNMEQGTEEWFKVRAGVPTASCFSKIVTSKGELSKSLPAYANKLAGELLVEKSLDDFEGNVWTERGKEMEAQARAYYEFENNCDVAEIGFVINDGVGCSPDGLVGDDGMLEIKCLKSENHIEAMLYFKKHGKAPTKYIPQVQAQMWVCGRAWCDLLFFHPDLPNVVVRITPDKKVVEGMEKGKAEILKQRDDALAILKEF